MRRMKFFKNKKLIKSIQVIVSVGLLIVVLRRIDVGSLMETVVKAPLWFVVVSFLFTILSMMAVSLRWSLLLLPKTSMEDFLFFCKASFIGRFYSMFLSSSMGGDLVKWVPLLKKYPELNKVRLASSVLLDRVIGFTAFVIVAFVSMLVGKFLKLEFPEYIFWLFSGLFVGAIVFYVFIFFFDFEKIFVKLRVPKRIVEVAEILTKTEKKKIWQAFLISLLMAPLWSLSGWLAFVAFGTGIPLLTTMIIMPVINLILILPVSVAGFGAREGLFVYFFSKYAVSNELVLASSAFAGVLNIVFSILGGVFTLF